jgi:hypothetical protein
VWSVRYAGSASALYGARSSASADDRDAAFARQFAALRGLCSFPGLYLLLKLLSPSPLDPIHYVIRKIWMTHFKVLSFPVAPWRSSHRQR